jgi:hypothetical protein
MEGYLYKKKNGNSLRFFTNFTKRWFVIDPYKNIFYYTTEPGKPPKKSISYNVSFL